MPEDNHVTRALPQSPQKTLKAGPLQSGGPECVYVDHAAHWVDVLGLAGWGHSRHGRPTPDSEGLLLPNGQFEVPVYEVSRTSQPEVEQTLEKAIQQGQPTLLQRTTDKSIIRQNRAEATRGWDYTKGSPDEFPYASSRQGGAGSTVNGVSRSAQRSQGGSLSGCYRSNRIVDSDYYSSFIN